MKIILISLVLALTGVLSSVNFYWEGRFRFLNEGSQLGVFEKPLLSVSHALMRVSPELRRNFSRYNACVHDMVHCRPQDQTALFAERDQLVAEAWPKALKLLRVDSDWSSDREVHVRHQIFQELIRDIREYPDYEHVCIPVIKYTWSMGGGILRSYHQFDNAINCIGDSSQTELPSPSNEGGGFFVSLH